MSMEFEAESDVGSNTVTARATGFDIACYFNVACYFENECCMEIMDQGIKLIE